MKNIINTRDITAYEPKCTQMFRASQIVLEDGRILENVIKDMERKIDELKRDSPYTYIIHNQDEFNDWVLRKRDDETDYSNVLMYPGEYIFDPNLKSNVINLDHTKKKTLSLTGSTDGRTKIICIDHYVGAHGNGSYQDAILNNIDIEMQFTKDYENIMEGIYGLMSFNKIENVNLTILLNDNVKNIKEVTAVHSCKNINNCNFTIKDTGSYTNQRLFYGFLKSTYGYGNRVIIETQSDAVIKQFQSGCYEVEEKNNSYYA